MISNNLNMQNLRHYGMHGAFGLLMGAGIGTILTFFLGPILSPLEFLVPSFLGDPLTVLGRFSFHFIVFTVFGLYMGYIFEKEKEYSIFGAIAGIFCGGAAALLSSNFETIGDIALIVTYMIVLGVAGEIFGLPKARKMILLAVSGVLGGMVGTSMYVFGQHLTYFLKDVGIRHHLSDFFPLAIIFFVLLLSILAIATAGASLSLGMYIAGGMVYSRREIPMTLKIMRNSGIVLIILVLLVSMLISFNYANYASSKQSIYVESDTGEMKLYVPVLLDNKGNVLEMYEHPEVTGNATTAIIDTQYGKALKISGSSGDVEINMQQTHGIQSSGRQYYRFSLSMSDYIVGQHPEMIDIWVYSAGEVDAAGIIFDLKSGEGMESTVRTKPRIRLSEGWQKVRLEDRTSFWD